jgi:selenium metabolism protein YedF
MSNIIDCKGLKCPQPVINTKKYFDSIEEGEATIIVDNEVAKSNILKFAQNNGYKNVVKEEEGLFHIKISKENCNCQIRSFEGDKFTIVISTDKLGEGEEELGKLLMKSYLYALSESDRIPNDLIFLNSGVKLTTEGSDSFDSLKKLVDRGVNILSCGTCLDFYGIKEKLLLGEISNMYTIVEKMNTADKTIKL